MAGIRNLDAEPELWYACAGPLVQIPPPNSLVYYFMQGHIEHCGQSINMANHGARYASRTRILCRVLSVNYFSDAATDQVFAKFRLKPLLDPPLIDPDDSLDDNPGPPYLIQIYPEAVIRGSSVLPTLPMLDLHHNLREFSFIAIGTVAFVDGSWGELMSQMGVVEGDRIVMLNNRVGVLKRKTRTANNGLHYSVDYLYPFAEAICLAAHDKPFEVCYYPRVSTPEFVVKAARVEAAMQIPWQVGMRFSMQYEDELTSLTTTCSGTISSVEDVDHRNWPDSPWRRFKIRTDYPNLKLNGTLVNPWMLKLEASPDPEMSDSEAKLCTDSQDV